MKLSDIMANSGLWGYTIIATLLFVAVYVSQVVWTFLPRNRSEMDRAGGLPFDDGQLAASTAANPHLHEEVRS